MTELADFFVKNARRESRFISLLAQKPPSVIAQHGHKAVVWAILFVCWLLSFTAFQQYGRTSPMQFAELDWIGVVKIIIRGLSTVILAIILLKPQMVQERRLVSRKLLPMMIFAVWAMVSTLWSPLKMNSLGHASELLMCVMLAAASGIYFSDERYYSVFFKHLSIIILLFSAISLYLFYKFPSAEGWEDSGRPFGFATANLAAQISGLGLIILFVFSILWEMKWSRLLLIPGVAIEGWFLIKLGSRIALLATAVIVIGSLLFIRKRQYLAGMFFLLGIMGTLLICFGWFENIISSAGTYIMRSQTRDELLTGTGRIEVWQKYFAFFRISPLIGNGYFTLVPMAADKSGQMVGAHNIFLGVLSGTGLIGGLLFAWGILSPLAAVWRRLRINPAERRLAILILVSMVWFFATSQTETTLLGPISPVTIGFYVILGVAAGKLK